MDVSKNSGTPKSSILIGISITNHPFWGTFIFGRPIYFRCRACCQAYAQNIPWWFFHVPSPKNKNCCDCFFCRQICMMIFCWRAAETKKRAVGKTWISWRFEYHWRGSFLTKYSAKEVLILKQDILSLWVSLHLLRSTGLYPVTVAFLKVSKSDFFLKNIWILSGDWRVTWGLTNRPNDGPPRWMMLNWAQQ